MRESHICPSWLHMLSNLCGRNEEDMWSHILVAPYALDLATKLISFFFPFSKSWAYKDCAKMKKKSSTAHASMKVHCFVGVVRHIISVLFFTEFTRWPKREYLTTAPSVPTMNYLVRYVRGKTVHRRSRFSNIPIAMILESGKCLALWGAPIHTLTPYTCRSKCMLEFTKAANVYEVK